VQGERLRRGLTRLARRVPALTGVRGRGLMLGVSVRDPESGEPSPALRDRIVTAAFRSGLLMLPAGRDAIRFTPPLVVGAREIAEALRRLETALASETEVAPTRGAAPEAPALVS
jgi:4-aminobutyrate aminotransferase-like enzyme